MSTRMDKYNRDSAYETESRTNRNKERYDNTPLDYENVNLSSNVSIIDASTEDLDIDKLKELLDEKYKRSTKETQTLDLNYESALDLENTKEYDLKKILDAAHQNKKTNYDQERFKKLRETQYEILSSLNIDGKKRNAQDEEEETLTEEEENLMNLIKTVNYNASKSKSEVPISEEEINTEELLTDLLGNDDTLVLGPMSFDDDESEPEVNEEVKAPDKKPTLVEELERTKQLSKTSILGALHNYQALKEEEVEQEDITTEDISKEEITYDNQEDKPSPEKELANSFYTGKLHIDNEDMVDFEDLEGMGASSIVIKVLIIIIVLIILAFAVYFLNKYLNLGLF